MQILQFCNPKQHATVFRIFQMVAKINEYKKYVNIQMFYGLTLHFLFSSRFFTFAIALNFSNLYSLSKPLFSVHLSG